MDPNANINEQLCIAEAILNDDSASDLPEKATRLAELVHALDDWICKGGALPSAWKRNA